MPAKKFSILLECLLSYTHPIVYPKCIGIGIQTTVKPNELSSAMTVRRYGFHNGAMTYTLQFGESTPHRNFVVWVVFMKAIFSSLNLKVDYGFLPYSMPEVFKKTDYGFTDIMIT